MCTIAYHEGYQDYMDWLTGRSHSKDNRYCLEDPRHQQWEDGMLAAYEAHEVSLCA